MAKTIGQVISEYAPHLSDGKTSDEMDEIIRSDLLSPDKRPAAIAFLKKNFSGLTDLPDDAVMMKTLGGIEQDREARKQQRLVNMQTQAREQNALRRKEDQKSAALDTELKDNLDPNLKDKKQAGLRGPGRLERAVMNNRRSADEIDLNPAGRARETYKNYDEMMVARAQNPGSRIVTNGIDTWLVTPDGRMIGQGMDSQMSFDPFDVEYAAEGMGGKAGQAFIGQLAGGGSIVQQGIANAVRNRASGAELDPDAAQWRFGYGLPELAQEGGGELGKRVDLTPLADPSVKAMGAVSGFLGGVEDSLRGLAPAAEMLNPRGRSISQMIKDEQERGPSKFSQMGEQLSTGVPNDLSGNKEMSQELGETLLRPAGILAQMRAPTEGEWAIRYGVKPLVQKGAEGLRSAGRSLMNSPNSPLPASAMIEDPLRRAQMKNLEQVGRSAPDIYARDVETGMRSGAVTPEAMKKKIWDEGMEPKIKSWNEELGEAEIAKPSRPFDPTEPYVGQRLSDLNMGGKTREEAQDALAQFNKESHQGRLTAREADLYDESAHAGDEIAGITKTARAEFVKNSGPWRMQVKELEKDLTTSPKIHDDLIAQELPRLRDQNISVIKVGPQPQNLRTHGEVVYLPSTGDEALDKLLNNSTMDRYSAFALKQMAEPGSVAVAAHKTAKFFDQLLATDAAATGITRAKPGFDFFQRFSEYIRVTAAEPEAHKVMSKVGKFIAEDGPLMQEIRRKGSYGYGQTAEALGLKEKPAWLFGEAAVTNQTGTASKAYRATRKLKDVLQIPGEASAIAADEVWRGMFKDLPPGVKAEDAIKVWHVLAQVERGVNPEIAINNMNRLLVNFADKNPGQVAIRPLVPFIKWISAAMTGAFDIAMQNPRSYRRLYDFMRMVQTGDTAAHDGKPLDPRIKDTLMGLMGIPVFQVGEHTYKAQIPSPATEIGDIGQQLASTVGESTPFAPNIAAALTPTIQESKRALTGHEFSSPRVVGAGNTKLVDNAFNLADSPPMGPLTPAQIAYMQENMLGEDGTPVLQPEEGLGPNPKMGALLETLRLIPGSAGVIPPYMINAAQVASDRVSPQRLVPGADEEYWNRLLLSMLLGLRASPVDPEMAGNNATAELKKKQAKPQEQLRAQETVRGKLPDGRSIP